MHQWTVPIDDLGRTTLPDAVLAQARWLDAGGVCVAPEPGRRFLELMTATTWNERMKRVAALPHDDPVAIHYRWFLLACDGVVGRVRLHERTRLRIPRWLQNIVGIDTDDRVVWRLRDDVAELWSKDVATAGDDDDADDLAQQLPAFLADAERTTVGPFAVWGRTAVGTMDRWWGVDRADPSTRVAVLTSTVWSHALHVFNTFDVRGRRDGVQKDGPVFWAARSSHPGPTLAELLARAPQGAPPIELFIAVARALTDGARTCRPVADDFDVVVGVDGVITVDGLDDRRPTTWRPGYGPTLDDDVACRRLVRAVLGAHVDAGDVLARLREADADADDRDRERLFVAGLVRGLAPDVVERERERADELATLGRHAWASWSTVADAGPRGRP